MATLTSALSARPTVAHSRARSVRTSAAATAPVARCSTQRTALAGSALRYPPRHCRPAWGDAHTPTHPQQSGNGRRHGVSPARGMQGTAYRRWIWRYLIPPLSTRARELCSRVGSLHCLTARDASSGRIDPLGRRAAQADPLPLVKGLPPRSKAGKDGARLCTSCTYGLHTPRPRSGHHRLWRTLETSDG